MEILYEKFIIFWSNSSKMTVTSTLEQEGHVVNSFRTVYSAGAIMFPHVNTDIDGFSSDD